MITDMFGFSVALSFFFTIAALLPAVVGSKGLGGSFVVPFIHHHTSLEFLFAVPARSATLNGLGRIFFVKPGTIAVA